MRRITRLLSIALLAAWCLRGQQGPDTALAPGEFLRHVENLPLPGEPAATPRQLAPREGTKIDPRLRRLVSAAREGQGTRGVDAAARLPVVVRTLAVNQVAAVEAAIRSAGGEVTARFENVIWAGLPPSAVEAISGRPAVLSAILQTLDRPEQASHPGAAAPLADGVRSAHIDLLHRRGFTGRSVRIGILDLGFGGYSRLQRDGRVAAARAQRAFPDSYGVENRQVHGTACAEIVHAVAPGAEVLLASFDGHEGNLVAAAQWLISQGAQIISYSAGNTEAPTDGTDAVSRFIDSTSRRDGVLWAIAAGNHGDRHWSGPTATRDSHGWLRLGEGVRGLEVTPLTNTLRLVIRWDDWGPDPRKPSATEDIDAFLFRLDASGKLEAVASSTDPQDGGASRPLEVVEYSGRNIAGHPLLLVLKARRLAHQATVHVFLDSSGRLFPATPAGSVLNPASARSALAVGAVDVLTGELARYSSQGPTDDRRLKPEVSAPANTVSWAYAGNEGRFPGTSASCPHAAGFAALLKEMEPQTPVAELRLLVMRSVVPHGSPHPNSLYGFGEIDGQVPAVAKARALEIAASAPVEIPVEFGGIVAPGTLAELRQLSGREQDGPAVRIVTGRDLYQIGDEIAIGVSASEDSACLLFLRDATGSYSLLSPRDSALTLAKGEWLWLPGPGEGRLRIAGPEGSDELLLICAPHATPLDSAMRGGLAVASHSYQIVEARP